MNHTSCVVPLSSCCRSHSRVTLVALRAPFACRPFSRCSHSRVACGLRALSLSSCRHSCSRIPLIVLPVPFAGCPSLVVLLFSFTHRSHRVACALHLRVPFACHPFSRCSHSRVACALHASSLSHRIAILVHASLLLRCPRPSLILPLSNPSHGRGCLTCVSSHISSILCNLTGWWPYMTTSCAPLALL